MSEQAVDFPDGAVLVVVAVFVACCYQYLFCLLVAYEARALLSIVKLDVKLGQQYGPILRHLERLEVPLALEAISLVKWSDHRLLKLAWRDRILVFIYYTAIVVTNLEAVLAELELAFGSVPPFA